MKIKEIKDRLKKEPPKDFKKLQGLFKKLGVVGGLMMLFPLTALFGGFMVTGASFGGLLCQLPNKDIKEDELIDLKNKIVELEKLRK
jgi:hypothetical protein